MGVRDGGTSRVLTRAVGMRELAAAIRAGQCHVHRYMRPLLERIRNGEIYPSFVISHQLPLEDEPRGFDMFKHQQDDCTKVVLKP